MVKHHLCTIGGGGGGGMNSYEFLLLQYFGKILPVMASCRVLYKINIVGYCTAGGLSLVQSGGQDAWLLFVILLRSATEVQNLVQLLIVCFCFFWVRTISKNLLS